MPAALPIRSARSPFELRRLARHAHDGRVSARLLPRTWQGVGLALPEAGTAAMNLLLAELARALPVRTHAVPVLDRGGWHVGDGLQIPGNLTLLHLPSPASELNPVGKVRQDRHDRRLGHRVLPDYRAVLDAACRTWNALRAEPDSLHPRTSFPWLTTSVLKS